jgi:GGDEF domain-containing protein
MRGKATDRLSWRWPRVLALALVLLTAITVANIQLHGRSRVHENTWAQLNELNVLLHEESSLQWKTLASRNTPVKVAGELGSIRLRVRATERPGADDGDRLLREADEAMYRVKQAAKGGFALSGSW